MGDERDRHNKRSDEPDVEAHRFRRNEEQPSDDADAEKDDDTPDVEAHRHNK